MLCWYRFIDDLFIVWTGSRTLLNEFIKALNHNSDNLYFTYTFDATRIPYLDLMIIKNPDGTIGTDLYWKPTAGNTLLHASSTHPKSLVRSIPFAQYLHLRRNCAWDEDFFSSSSFPTWTFTPQEIFLYHPEKGIQ